MEIYELITKNHDQIKFKFLIFLVVKPHFKIKNANEEFGFWTAEIQCKNPYIGYRESDAFIHRANE